MKHKKDCDSDIMRDIDFILLDFLDFFTFEAITCRILIGHGTIYSILY